MTDQPAEAIPLFPPSWFVENLNAGVSRDWAGAGSPPVRTALDPLVMHLWHLATENLRKPMPFVPVVII
jgi:hypothetical protein